MMYQDGDIILMHDIHTESIDAALVPDSRNLKKQAINMTVSEMAKAKALHYRTVRSILISGQKM